MKNEKMRKGTYTGLSIPINLIEQIEKITKNDPQYKSITDFVKIAIEEKIENMIIENRLEADFQKIIFRDLIRQKRLEALKQIKEYDPKLLKQI